MLRLIIRLVKLLVFMYGLWSAWRNSRWLGALGVLWAIANRRPRQDTGRKAQMVFVSALEPAIYQRKGWRKLTGRQII